MYINSYQNTNIDKDLKNGTFNVNNDSSKNKFNFSKYKKFIFILLGLIILIGVIFLVFKFKSNDEYEENYTINVFSENEILLSVGSPVVIPNYTATDYEGDDVTADVIVDNEVDNQTPGEYLITFSLGEAYQEVKVKVVENTNEKIPIIINKDSIMYLNVGDTYTEYGCIAYSNGVDYCKNVDISSNVDTSTAGIYKVIYNVKSSSGVTFSAYRTVIVLDSDLTLLEKSNYNGTAVIRYVTNSNYFSYILLPDGSKTTNKEGEYTIEKSGTYKFVLYNSKGGVFEKSINITVNQPVVISSSSSSSSKSSSSSQSSSSSSSKQEDDMTNAVTVNIGSFNAKRARKDAKTIGQYFKKYDLVYVGMQEAKPISETLSLASWVKNVGKYSEMTYTSTLNTISGLGVVSKYKLSSVKTDRYSTGGERRGYIKAVVNINGVNITIFDTHFSCANQDEDMSKRTKQVAELMKLIEAESNPVIVLGDLNLKDNASLIKDKLFSISGYEYYSSRVDFIIIWGKGHIKLVNGQTLGTKALGYTDHDFPIATIKVY